MGLGHSLSRLTLSPFPKAPGGHRPALFLCLDQQARASPSPCGSGHAREKINAVDGTGIAGVRGRARSHRGGWGLAMPSSLFSSGI
ncbi:hypothetical protein EGJ22_13185 [Pseudomonas sp. p99-361]|nr:hypothetical protein EGJ22_13185 [Pseudomonas sp. p99-361]